MKELKDGYKELYESANISSGYRLNKENVCFDNLSHFVGMKGQKYEKNKPDS